jgi:hypothetical protein
MCMLYLKIGLRNGIAGEIRIRALLSRVACISLITLQFANWTLCWTDSTVYIVLDWRCNELEVEDVNF